MIQGLDGAGIGCHPISWEGKIPFPQFLDEIKALAYEGTEGYGDYRDNTAGYLSELGSRGLRLASVYAGGAYYDPQRAEEAVQNALAAARFVHAMGGTVLCVATGGDEQRRSTPGLYPDGKRPDGLDATGWQTLADSLKRVGEGCLQLGIEAAFHNHVGTFVETRDEIDRLFALVDAAVLFFAPDTGHLYYGGADPVAACRDYAARIRYTHLKDTNAEAIARARRERMVQRDCMAIGGFCELGQGCIDLPAIFQALASARYTGWLMVEQDKTLKTPVESARISRDYLRTHLGR